MTNKWNTKAEETNEYKGRVMANEGSFNQARHSLCDQAVPQDRAMHKIDCDPATPYHVYWSLST